MKNKSRVLISEHPARLERVTGIEPARPAWKAGILPLNYTRVTRYIIPHRSFFVKCFVGADFIFIVFYANFEYCVITTYYL